MEGRSFFQKGAMEEGAATPFERSLCLAISIALAIDFIPSTF